MRFAVVGCGEAGTMRAAAIRAVDGAKLIVCVDTIEARAQLLAAIDNADFSTDWRAAIARDDVDAVIVATSNNLHAPVAVAAAEAGKHILCERPLARNPVEADQIVNAARQSGVQLETGFSRRHHPAVAKASELVRNGQIGRITFMRARSGRGSYAARATEWAIDPELSGGGTLLDNGTDLLDLCRYIMGDFCEVVGRVSTDMWPIEPSEDNAFAILTTGDGHSAVFHSSWTDWSDYLFMDIFGTEGYVRLNFDESTVTLGCRPGSAGETLGEVFDLSAEPDRSLEIEVKDLMMAVQENREPVVSGIDGLEELILVHAIYRSSAEGVVVKL